MATSSTSRKEVVWSWKSNTDPYDQSQKVEWKRYSDLQIHAIEEAYKSKEQCVELAGYMIDFKAMVQYRKGDEYRQRSVKREDVDGDRYLREARFGIAEKPKQISQSFGEPGEFFETAKLIEEWKRKNKHLCNNKGYSKVIEQAVDGILSEARRLKLEGEGTLSEVQQFELEDNRNKIADLLLKVKDKTLKQIHDCCIHIYSLESFLYKILNQSLRNEDVSKVDTLGAYCYLLLLNLYDSEKENSTLYRGCELTVELIDYYKESVGKQVIWSTFTSLSRSKKKAQEFGCALFIVQLTGKVYCSKDIAGLSRYPNEEEVLLRPAHPLWVEKVEWDEESKKHLIHMNDDPDYRPKESDRPLL